MEGVAMEEELHVADCDDDDEDDIGDGDDGNCYDNDNGVLNCL